MVEVSFEDTNVCESVKVFINWVISELNLEYKKQIKFVYFNALPSITSIYWEPDKGFTADQIKEILTKPYFLHSMIPYSIFKIFFPSGYEFSFDMRFLVYKIIRAGGRISFEGITNDQDRIVFIQSFVNFSGYFMKDFSDKKSISINDVFETAPMTSIYSTNYYQEVKETIQNKLIIEQDYTIEYKFMKAVKDIEQLVSDNIAYGAWLRSEKNWNEYCKMIGITPIEIYHKDLENRRRDPKKQLIKFIKRDDKNEKAWIDTLEKVYSISIPKKFYEKAMQIHEWMYNEDDFIEFMEVNPDFIDTSVTNYVCLERTTVPMINFAEFLKDVRADTSFIIDNFDVNTTVEHYKKVIALTNLSEEDHARIANIIYVKLGNFTFGDVMKIWAKKHNYHAEKGNTSKFIRISKE